MKKLLLCVFIIMVFAQHPAHAAWKGLGWKLEIDAVDVITDTTNFDTNLSTADVNLKLALDTLDELVTAGGTTDAVDVVPDVTDFDGNLSGSDSDLQTALETIDELALGGSTAWDDIGNPDNSGLTTITFDNAELTLFTGDNDAAASFVTIQNSDGNHTVGSLYLLDLDYSADDGDAEADYIKCQDSGSVVFSVQQNGETAMDGGITSGGTIEGATLTEGGNAVYNTTELTLATVLALGADANDLDITSMAQLQGVDVNTYIDMDTTDIITTKGNLIPSANGADDLGTDALEYNNAWFDGTMEADAITEGGNVVYSSGETPSGELGGTYANITVDSSIHDDEYVELEDPLTAVATLVDPDTTQAIIDAVTIFPIEAERFPNGITITDCGIKTAASSSYTVVFEEWTAPGTHANDLESVATSATLEAADDGTIGNGSGGGAGDCNVGSIIKIDLPATDIDELSVWIVFTVNQS